MVSAVWYQFYKAWKDARKSTSGLKSLELGVKTQNWFRHISFPADKRDLSDCAIPVGLAVPFIKWGCSQRPPQRVVGRTRRADGCDLPSTWQVIWNCLLLPLLQCRPALPVQCSLKILCSKYGAMLEFNGTGRRRGSECTPVWILFSVLSSTFKIFHKKDNLGSKTMFESRLWGPAAQGH